MTAFEIVEAENGAGQAGYDAGLFTMPDGGRRGIETLTGLDSRADSRGSVPEMVETLRGALPAGGGLALPLRLAVSSLRAGLGVIEENFADGLVEVRLEFAGAVYVARMPSDLLALIRRDRSIVQNALARTGQRPAAVAQEESSEPADSDTGEALTSIFRYEKRNGRLRRVAASEP